jgi:hypothetical protein
MEEDEQISNIESATEADSAFNENLSTDAMTV